MISWISMKNRFSVFRSCSLLQCFFWKHQLILSWPGEACIHFFDFFHFLLLLLRKGDCFAMIIFSILPEATARQKYAPPNVFLMLPTYQSKQIQNFVQIYIFHKRTCKRHFPWRISISLIPYFFMSLEEAFRVTFETCTKMTVSSISQKHYFLGIRFVCTSIVFFHEMNLRHFPAVTRLMAHWTSRNFLGTVSGPPRDPRDPKILQRTSEDHPDPLNVAW